MKNKVIFVLLVLAFLLVACGPVHTYEIVDALDRPFTVKAYSCEQKQNPDYPKLIDVVCNVPPPNGDTGIYVETYDAVKSLRLVD